MSAENYRSATKSHDPGWNDPPKLSYSPDVAKGQTPKLNLNKRIAFPVAGSTVPSPSATVAATSVSSLPQFVPVSAGPPNPGPPSNSILGTPPLGTPPRASLADKHASGQPDKFLVYPEDEKMRNFVINTLEEILLKIDGSRQAEIRKRLEMMHQSWNDGKLSDGLVKKLYQLTLALKEGKVSQANDGHRSIIVEHGKECVQWAPALRQLVQAVSPKLTETVLDATMGEKEAITKPL